MVPEAGLEPALLSKTDFELTAYKTTLLIFNDLHYNTIILIQHSIQL
jgi:hypothetical protein